MVIYYCMHTICSAPINGQNLIDYGSRLVNMTVKEDNCTFSCDPCYMLQGWVARIYTHTPPIHSTIQPGNGNVKGQCMSVANN